MSDKSGNQLTTDKRNPGFFGGIGNQIKLVIKLITDRRVNLALKILPLGTLLYLLAPDIFPGPVDDALIISLGLYTFVELCPDDVVQEHRATLGMPKADNQANKNG